MIIRVRHLSHCFGSTEVLHDVNFEVERAAIFGFIGPNGAGKTTTIRAMATLLEPSAGRIEIAGIDVELEPERVRAKIGYMADQAGIYPKLTVDEYLAFFAVASGLPPSPTVDRALDLAGLGELRNELTGNLSKGMRQRLQLAKTVLHDPEVLILDEPASDLDPRARIEMRDLFLRLRAAGKTIFLSSHILTELSDVCTSIAVLEKGHLLASGPIAELAHKLASPEFAAPSAALGPPASVGPPLYNSIKIRVLGNAEAAAQVLYGSPGIAKVEVMGDVLLVQVEPDPRRTAELVKRLVYAGIDVAGVVPERDDLERVFLELTQKG